ncbi:MAG TPA: OadG family transporter subunit [Spirochaetota bacterium]|jgi:oxaloacetate decarboxylase gamma subunit|nr:MAG: oxaloacetate decarboxylase subunit gamma [Spirochaetes bacterium ADurb.Bin133]HNZ26403.1 OadG family transporter subunit [Spirochaetota bacterium]HPY87035.1 OadG family transporter subunit [Spirochaetota bacterium]HQB61756.1 OadG family transporter subunit [Spirochaetota bacterium]
MSDVSRIIGEAAIVMVIGMGVVFVFLIILVFLVNIVGKLIKLSGADKVVEVKSPSKERDDYQATIAAISFAFKQRM